MGINFNPNKPGKIGPEHLDSGYAHFSINAPNRIGALRWQATRTGEIDDVQFYAGTGAVAPVLDARYNGLNRPMIVDLVPAGSEPTDTIIFNDFTVTAITGGTGMFNENLTTPITTSRLNSFNDGLYVTSNVLGSSFDVQFSTGAYSLSRHVLAVEVWANINLTTRIRRIDPVSSPWYYDIPAFSSSFTLGSLRIGETIVDGSDATWRHWTPQMIRDYASGGTRKVRVYCQAGPGYWKIDRVFLRVYSITERRRGVGIGSPTTGLSWVNFDMQTPPATGSPTTTSGESLTWLLRRITDYSVDTIAPFTVMPWRYLRGRAQEFTKWQWREVVFNPFIGIDNVNTLAPDGILTARTLDGGSVVSDTMPYNLSRGVRVFDGQDATQRLSVPAGTTVYGQAFVVAGWNPSDGRPTAPLRCEGTRVSDGVRVFSPVEVTADDVSRLPTSAPFSAGDDEGAFYKTVRFRFPESSDLTTGTYDIKLSSPGNPSDRSWRISCLLADAHTADQTYGGATEFATAKMNIGGVLTDVTSATYVSDLLVELVEVPPAPTGVATAIGSLTVHHATLCDVNRGCDGCADETLPYTALTWSPSASGTPDVAGYQIDRQDDISTDWARVALVRGRTNTAWQDQEARIGVQSRYRVRVIRTDDVTGDWSATASLTIPVGQVALSFSSNAATGMGCVYPEVWEGEEVVREWKFQEFDDVQFSTMYGRDKQVAFRPLERKGDTFDRTLMLNALCSVQLPTMSIFQPMRDLAWAPIPYVCVRDGEGNRWLAAIQLPTGRNVRPGERWFGDVTVTEVASTPAIIDTAVPQVESVQPVSQVLSD